MTGWQSGSGYVLSYLYNLSRERCVHFLLFVMYFFCWQTIKIEVKSDPLPDCQATKQIFLKTLLYEWQRNKCFNSKNFNTTWICHEIRGTVESRLQKRRQCRQNGHWTCNNTATNSTVVNRMCTVVRGGLLLTLLRNLLGLHSTRVAAE